MPYVEQTGVLVVRLWTDGTGCTGMRARITHTLAVSQPEDSVVFATSATEINRIVSGWVDAFDANSRVRWEEAE